MNEVQIKSFLELKNCSSYSEIAIKLGYTPQNIHSSLKRLENELQSKLYFSSKTGFTLTDLGNKVYEEFESMKCSYNKIISYCENKPLRIGILPLTLSSFEHEFINYIQKNSINVSFHFYSFTQEILAAFENGEIDVYFDVKDNISQFISLFDSRYMLASLNDIAKNNDVISLEELATVTLIVSDEINPLFYQTCISKIKEANYECNLIYENDDNKGVLLLHNPEYGILFTDTLINYFPTFMSIAYIEDLSIPFGIHYSSYNESIKKIYDYSLAVLEKMNRK